MLDDLKFVKESDMVNHFVNLSIGMYEDCDFSNIYIVGFGSDYFAFDRELESFKARDRV